jgi:hypothetical protein
MGGIIGKPMLIRDDVFQASVRQQIALNRARTPTQRFEAFFELLEVARAMAPRDGAARQRRLRAAQARQHDREQWRVTCRRFLTTQRADVPPSV